MRSTFVFFFGTKTRLVTQVDFSNELGFLEPMKLRRYGFALRLCEATEGLSDWSSTGVKIECVLGEFPENT